MTDDMTRSSNFDIHLAVANNSDGRMSQSDSDAATEAADARPTGSHHHGGHHREHADRAASQRRSGRSLGASPRHHHQRPEENHLGWRGSSGRTPGGSRIDVSAQASPRHAATAVHFAAVLSPKEAPFANQKRSVHRSKLRQREKKREARRKEEREAARREEREESNRRFQARIDSELCASRAVGLAAGVAAAHPSMSATQLLTRPIFGFGSPSPVIAERRHGGKFHTSR